MPRRSRALLPRHTLSQRLRADSQRRTARAAVEAEGYVQRLGHPNALESRAALQPAQLPTGQRLAARQRADPGGVQTLRLQQRSPAAVRSAPRCRRRSARTSPPGAVRRFRTRSGRAPAGPYPVACSPQAWAAAAMPYALVSLLGLQPDALEHRLRIVDPSLPAGIDRLSLAR